MPYSDSVTPPGEASSVTGIIALGVPVLYCGRWTIMTTLLADPPTFSLGDFDSMDAVFAMVGSEMRTHRGRSVAAVSVDGARHYLKRFWFDPRRPFKRSVARGVHELRMIDWLSGHGFSGPRVVRRGCTGRGLLGGRVFFLMPEVADERPLEAAWRADGAGAGDLLDALARFAASLHDAEFCHTDFSERHILVGGSRGSYRFRLIDLERARVGGVSESDRAADLATLAASVLDERLREAIVTRVVDRYVAARATLSKSISIRCLLKRAQPTKSF